LGIPNEFEPVQRTGAFTTRGLPVPPPDAYSVCHACMTCHGSHIILCSHAALLLAAAAAAAACTMRLPNPPTPLPPPPPPPLPLLLLRCCLPPPPPTPGCCFCFPPPVCGVAHPSPPQQIMRFCCLAQLRHCLPTAAEVVKHEYVILSGRLEIRAETQHEHWRCHSNSLGMLQSLTFAMQIAVAGMKKRGSATNGSRRLGLEAVEEAAAAEKEQGARRRAYNRRFKLAGKLDAVACL